MIGNSITGTAWRLLQERFGRSARLDGKRVLITGAARGIGAALAVALHKQGAKIALMGLEPEHMAQVAAECGNAPWLICDVGDAELVEDTVNDLVAELGGLDIVVANAGIARQLALIGGDLETMEQTLRVNLLGVYYTLRAAGPHISHPNGYALLTSSLAAAIHLPLMGAYSASKAGVESLGNTARQELRHTGVRVGVAYYGELETDMTSRGFSTEAAKEVMDKVSLMPVAPLDPAIDRIVRGVKRRSRRVVAPWWVGFALPFREIVQLVVEIKIRRAANLQAATEIARTEKVSFTTEQTS